LLLNRVGATVGEFKHEHFCKTLSVVSTLDIVPSRSVLQASSRNPTP